MRFCTTCGARFGAEIAFCTDCGVPTQELPTAAPAGDPYVGRTVDGRYRIDRAIGEGGMGVVYQATHAVLGKKIALKVLRQEMARDEDVVQRFIQEAQAASTIGHPNIIEISDFGRLQEGAVYFVMEYLEGEALTDLIARGGSLPMTDAIAIIQQIASALGAAHQRGIVHSDLKPDNVFLVKRGESSTYVKVLDFGIAKVGGAASKLTRTGVVFGTPHYMSPEQAAGQSVDQRTDIYALGVIMYEVFTGKVPFDADTFMGILTKHMFESPIPPSATAGKQLGAVEDVILKALSKKPEARYQTMDELIADLQRIAAGGQAAIARARADGVAVPANLADALEPPTRTEVDLAAQPLPTSRTPLLVAAVIGAIALGGGIAGGVYALTANSGNVRVIDAGVALAPDPLQPASQTKLASPTDVVQPRQGPGNGTTQPVGAGTGGNETAPAVEQIQITSVPAGAEVLEGDIILGNTPFSIPRPTGTELRRLQLRQAGFLPKDVQVGAASGVALNIALEPVQVAVVDPVSSHRPRNTTNTTMRTTGETTVQPPPDTSMTPTTMRTTSSSSEVVDPWAQ